jgi:hypothetical protein
MLAPVLQQGTHSSLPTVFGRHRRNIKRERNQLDTRHHCVRFSDWALAPACAIAAWRRGTAEALERFAMPQRLHHWFPQQTAQVRVDRLVAGLLPRMAICAAKMMKEATPLTPALPRNLPVPSGFIKQKTPSPCLLPTTWGEGKSEFFPSPQSWGEGRVRGASAFSHSRQFHRFRGAPAAPPALHWTLSVGRQANSTTPIPRLFLKSF